jgi:hypothetical protein
LYTLRIMQQGCGEHDLQVGTFRQRQTLSQAINPQYVVEVMDRVLGRIPGARFFDRKHVGQLNG